MHTSARTVEDKDREEKLKLYMKDKIKRIWRLFRLASDSRALVWTLSWIEMLLIEIEEKGKFRSDPVALNIWRNVL